MNRQSESLKFSRRRLLRDAGLGAAMLPLLSTDRVARAAGGPKRFFAIVWTNGCLDFWPKEYSKSDETQFTLTEITKPLEPHKKDINLIAGLDLTVAITDSLGAPGRLHHAFPHILTGAKAYLAAGANAQQATGNAISLDQYLADALAKKDPTPIRSLEMGVFSNGPHFNMKFLSFRGAAQNGQPQGVAREPDPFKVYARIFGAGIPGGGGTTAMPDDRLLRLRRTRKSVFDVVSRDLTAIGKRLGMEDRQRIDSHMNSLRQTEMEMDALSATATVNVPSGKCAAPMMPDPTRFTVLKNPENIPAIVKLQIDLALAAMNCNLTRIATLAIGDAGNDEFSFPWLGPQFRGKGEGFDVRSHHDIAHASGIGPEHLLRKTLVDQWHMSLFAYVIERMKQYPEGNGTMLDNSLVGMFNTGRTGFSHDMDRLPWAIAGRAGGAFKTGRYIRLGGGARQYPHNGLLAAIADSLDVPTSQFGDPQLSVELPGLRG